MNRPLNHALRTPPPAAPTEVARIEPRRTPPPPADLEKLSLLELARLVGNLRLSAVVSLLGTLAVCAGAVFWAGQKFQCNLSALAMARPFTLRLSANTMPTDSSFQSLILTPGYLVADADGSTNMVLTLRQRNAQNLYDKVGEVIAQKAIVRSPGELFGSVGLPISSADAQESSFNWGTHRNNNRFHERFIDSATVQRFYDDGAILEYKLDRNGHAIATTLKWIRQG